MATNFDPNIVDDVSWKAASGIVMAGSSLTATNKVDLFNAFSSLYIEREKLKRRDRENAQRDRDLDIREREAKALESFAATQKALADKQLATTPATTTSPLGVMMVPGPNGAMVPAVNGGYIKTPLTTKIRRALRLER